MNTQIRYDRVTGRYTHCCPDEIVMLMSVVSPNWNLRVRGVAALAAAALAMLTLAPTDVALGDASCPDPANPELAPALGSLYQAIGPVMGSPTECAQVDGNGTTIQIMTTGLAIYTPGGLSIFASGDQHWSLSSTGLQTWTGNWHNGLYPPVTPVPSGPQPAPQDTRLASVKPLTVLQVPEDRPNSALLEDYRGGRLTVQTETSCVDLSRTVGEKVFVRSQVSGTDLILLEQHESCAIVSMSVADPE